MSRVCAGGPALFCLTLSPPQPSVRPDDHQGQRRACALEHRVRACPVQRKSDHAQKKWEVVFLTAVTLPDEQTGFGRMSARLSPGREDVRWSPPPSSSPWPACAGPLSFSQLFSSSARTLPRRKKREGGMDRRQRSGGGERRGPARAGLSTAGARCPCASRRTCRTTQIVGIVFCWQAARKRMGRGLLRAHRVPGNTSVGCYRRSSPSLHAAAPRPGARFDQDAAGVP